MASVDLSPHRDIREANHRAKVAHGTELAEHVDHCNIKQDEEQFCVEEIQQSGADKEQCNKRIILLLVLRVPIVAPQQDEWDDQPLAHPLQVSHNVYQYAVQMNELSHVDYHDLNEKNKRRSLKDLGCLKLVTPND